MAIELTTATQAELSGIRQSLSIPVYYPNILPEAKYNYNANPSSCTIISIGSILDFKGCQNLQVIRGAQGGSWGGATITTILNAQDLTNLENFGTAPALSLSNAGLSESLINQLFTDLPATTKTATIYVVNNPGAATCDTTIATNKGYTVVTE